LYLESEAHRDQRTKTARFFTPAATHKNYRHIMETVADQLVAELVAHKQGNLRDMSQRLALAVVTLVVGLTNSRNGRLADRIETFIRPPQPATGARQWWQVGQSLSNTLRFFLMDVQPAIAARRKRPQEDVISHLLAQHYRAVEILTECVTYLVAGMSTTREFICMAAWHLLERPELGMRYGQADEPTRHTMLQEILRLEPVIGRLSRKAEQDFAVATEHGSVTILAGSLIHMHVYDTNTDERAVGACPQALQADRERATGVQAAALSFGQGHHRCPGAYIAIGETDILLQRLLALNTLRIANAPRIEQNDVTQGYELLDFVVAV
jgi:cytochrome P450